MYKFDNIDNRLFKLNIVENSIIIKNGRILMDTSVVTKSLNENEVLIQVNDIIDPDESSTKTNDGWSVNNIFLVTNST